MSRLNSSPFAIGQVNADLAKRLPLLHPWLPLQRKALVGVEHAGENFILEVIWAPADKASLPLPMDERFLASEFVQVLRPHPQQITPFLRHAVIRDAECLERARVIDDGLPVIRVAAPELT